MDRQLHSAVSGQMEESKEKVEKCPRCNGKMTEVRTCHLRCGMCGAEYDCSDKGLLW